MNGVVLWTGQGQALIWCEDQGPLAFCELAELPRGQTLGCGDLVQFKACFHGKMRVACDVHRIEANAAPSLVDYLQSRSQSAVQARGADIIPFDPSAVRFGQKPEDDGPAVQALSL